MEFDNIKIRVSGSKARVLREAQTDVEIVIARINLVEGSVEYLEKRYKKGLRQYIEKKAKELSLEYKLNQIKKIESIHVAGKRWFQKSYGNTYNSVNFSINGISFYLEPTYGYDNHYLQRVNEFIFEHKLIDDSYKSYHLGVIAEKLDIEFTDRVIDVRRESEL